MSNQRKPDFNIDPLFLKRWSPRAMSGEPFTDQELFTLFEAARWAPSSYNAQPWRFIYAKRSTPSWDVLFRLLVPFNQSWAHTAAALVLILSRKNFAYNNEPANTHAFDAGAAWENLALQATIMGLVAHGMEGFDYERTRKDLNIPDVYQINAIIALGKPADPTILTPELQAKEHPSDRKPITELILLVEDIKKLA